MVVTSLKPWRHDSHSGVSGEDGAVHREEIRRMFKVEFGRATMTCLVENIFEDGEWAILEWRDPKGLRGCGFFQIRNDQIIFQRGYFDQLSFFRQQGISMTEKYLGPGE